MQLSKKQLKKTIKPSLSENLTVLNIMQGQQIGLLLANLNQRSS